jgi:hypothetical protein
LDGFFSGKTTYKTERNIPIYAKKVGKVFALNGACSSNENT